MKEGLLWFDDDRKLDLAQKVGRAAKYYRQKYGRRPNVCYVHPSQLTEETKKVDGVRVASLSTILMHHFWVGEEERN